MMIIKSNIFVKEKGSTKDMTDKIFNLPDSEGSLSSLSMSCKKQRVQRVLY